MRLLFCCIISVLVSTSSPVWAGTLAQFRTQLGEIDVELFDSEKPVTVENFLRYVRSGRYTDMIFHRLDPGFVIQGGGYFTTNRHSTNAIIDAVQTFGDITNEYGVGRVFSNQFGTLAMARVGGQTNSANSQWFFNLTNNAFLDSVDGGFTVFGRVVGDTNLLNRFNQPSTNSGIYRLMLGTPLNELPVLKPADVTYEDLIYVDITLLQVQVARNAAGLSEISWQSVSNKVNHVQFTPQFPPIWTELITTNGTGGLLRFVDPSSAEKERFYRVTVDY